MGKLIYRVCLVMILMVAVIGGIYYYMTFYQEEKKPDKGTFVDNMEQTIQKAEKERMEPFIENIEKDNMEKDNRKGKQEQKQIGNEGQEAVKQAGKGIRNVYEQMDVAV